MIKIKVTNPYFEKEYKVVERRGDIEYNLHNINHGSGNFLIFHTIDGKTITINPSHYASVEIVEDADND